MQEPNGSKRMVKTLPFNSLRLTAHTIFRRNLSKKERLEYLDAVQCILTKPPITPLDVAPGVGARYDDFIATHIQQTFSIHYVVCIILSVFDSLTTSDTLR